MDNVELSPATRWGMIATGLLQGLVCYLLIAWLAGKNHSWIVYGVPATVAFSSVLL
ncbi:transporter, partial [Escherichia coli]